MDEPVTSLGDAVSILRKHCGVPAPVPTTDPFELILRENVAYLATPRRRQEAFELLRNTVGTAPAAILSSRRGALEKVTSHGILKGTFAAKLRQCARLAVDEYGGDVGAALRRSPSRAKQALRSFPGIGEPGADRILLFAGLGTELAPDSNGLRVLVRLGLVREESSYARTYAASRRAAEVLVADPKVRQEAHLLLRQHGETMCRRARPRCEACPLAAGLRPRGRFVRVREELRRMPRCPFQDHELVQSGMHGVVRHPVHTS